MRFAVVSIHGTRVNVCQRLTASPDIASEGASRATTLFLRDGAFAAFSISLRELSFFGSASWSFQPLVETAKDWRGNVFLAREEHPRESMKMNLPAARRILSIRAKIKRNASIMTE